jgi:hypothetical protein
MEWYQLDSRSALDKLMGNPDHSLSVGFSSIVFFSIEIVKWFNRNRKEHSRVI